MSSLTEQATKLAALPASECEEGDIPIPDVSELIIQDDTPVDNVLHEKQMRLLTEPLYASWQTARPFLALANVGLFHEPKQTPVVPDVMLSVDVELPADWREHKKHLSYFVWERGKRPDVVIEIISNTKGEERGTKMLRYAGIGVAFYIIYDPDHHIQEPSLTCHILLGDEYEPMSAPFHFKKLGIGLSLWHGTFENQPGEWLRWTLPDGSVVPTGAERADQETQRADQESQRADQERQRADQARSDATGENIPDRRRALSVGLLPQTDGRGIGGLHRPLRQAGHQPPHRDRRFAVGLD